MRKLFSLAAMATLTGFAVVAPAPDASAAASCRDNYDKARAGYMYAYNGANCEGYLGSASSYDNNWGNSLGGFQKGDNNKASSVINKGKTSVVKFYQYTRPHEGFNPHICLTRAEGFVSNLSDDYWMNDKVHQPSVNNSISSHQWVSDTTACSAFAK